MSKVLTKFVMIGLETQRDIEHDYSDRNSPTYGQVVRAGEACVVKFSGVRGEPFGKYTPSASAQMTILNPAAAAIFREAWETYVKSGDPNAKAPEFYVTFKLDDSTGSE